MNFIPILLFWTLAIWGLASKRPILLYLFFSSMAFGSFAAIPTAITGGLTLTATPITALLLSARTYFDRDGLSAFLSLAILPDRLMLLTLFWIVALVTTYFAPLLFEGAVMVVPFRGLVSTTSILRPTPQNISQIAYLSISIVSVFSFARILQSAAMRQHALQALWLGGMITVLTGLADFASFYVPIKPLLEPFRTASYALLTDWEVLGAKRVVGLMPEASAYGSLCLGYLSALYFYRRALVNARLRDVYTPILLFALVLCCWLSTSSGTYIGVCVFLFVAGLEWSTHAISTGHESSTYRRGLAGELFIVALAICTLSILLIVKPDVLDPVYSLVDRMVFQKASSSSYHERGMWRSVALASLGDTYGLGVGVGSTRASSSVVAVFSNTGVLGGMLFYGFVVHTFARNMIGASKEESLLFSAFRFSFIPGFIVTMMTGDADFSPLSAFGFGLIVALTIAHSRPASPRPRMAVNLPTYLPFR